MNVFVSFLTGNEFLFDHRGVHWSRVLKVGV